MSYMYVSLWLVLELLVCECGWRVGDSDALKGNISSVCGAAGSLGDGSWYYLGGEDTGDTIFKYNESSSTGLTTKIDDNSTVVYGEAQFYTQINDAMLFMDGSYDDEIPISMYNLSSNKYVARFSGIPFLVHYDACIAADDEGLYISGGGHRVGFTVWDLFLVFYWDDSLQITSATWSSSQMQIARRSHACAVHGGKFWAFGGLTDTGPTNASERLFMSDIYSGSVSGTRIADITLPLYASRAVGAGDYVFVVGGGYFGIPTTPVSAVHVYHVDTEQMTLGAELPYRVAYHGLFAVGSVIHVVGGYSLNASQYEVQESTQWIYWDFEKEATQEPSSSPTQPPTEWVTEVPTDEPTGVPTEEEWFPIVETQLPAEMSTTQEEEDLGASPSKDGSESNVLVIVLVGMAVLVVIVMLGVGYCWKNAQGEWCGDRFLDRFVRSFSKTDASQAVDEYVNQPERDPVHPVPPKPNSSQVIDIDQGRNAQDPVNGNGDVVVDKEGGEPTQATATDGSPPADADVGNAISDSNVEPVAQEINRTVEDTPTDM